MTADGLEEHFDFNPTAKERLVTGLDGIGATMSHDHVIAAHENARPSWTHHGRCIPLRPSAFEAQRQHQVLELIQAQ